ncbi:MAG: PH domain-containing protein [Planctomycetes bacterium]|nr:PH domain-containing protein [Planctomycetota bacterium]
MKEAGAPDRRLAGALAPGEAVLWTGRPRGGLRLRPSDLFLVPFSLLWCGFIAFWEWMAFARNSPLFFKLWGIPFLLVGVYLLFGRYFVDALLRGRTRYAITSSRVLLVSGALLPRVDSLSLRNLPMISLRERADGSGDIVLGSPSPFAAVALPGWPGFREFTPPTLDSIPEVRRVHGILLQAQGAAG